MIRINGRVRSWRFRLLVKQALAMLMAVSLIWPMIVPVVAYAGGGVTGAIWTTDSGGAVVNENTHYASKQDVYLNGGPTGNGPGLPAGDYYIRVTDPSGQTVLGRSHPDTIHVGEDGHFPYNVQLWGFLYSASSGFASHGYDDSPNNGDEYKVWASQDADFANS